MEKTSENFDVQVIYHGSRVVKVLITEKKTNMGRATIEQFNEKWLVNRYEADGMPFKGTIKTKRLSVALGQAMQWVVTG